jgi:biotin carboxyl carrier protein
MRKYDLTINNNNYEVVVKNVTETEALVEVNGQEHTVSINQIESLILPDSVPKVTPEQKTGIKQVPSSVPPSAASADNIIAPMPGQIKAIMVREGDTVKAGQKLLIMEAMKLENKLPAPRDGKVTQILVRDGDIVSQGQELIIIK